MDGSSGSSPLSVIGIVIIGRNEGERFRKCLSSVIGSARAIVYVDSGSTDGSPAHARSHGVDVVDLDMSRPFTAARARNEGFHRLLAGHPGIEFVQFVDGDCILETTWIATAGEFLASHPEIAALSGTLREMHPESSVYNWLCDVEWNVAAGQTTAVGGNAMFRCAAFAAVGGFNEALIAHEEPELCLRLRGQGWKIWRLSPVMGWHDAAMFRFGQWWKRNVRGGYGVFTVAALHASTPLGIWNREVLRSLLWASLAVIAVVLALLISPWFLLLLLLYPAQIARLAMRRGVMDLRSWQYASFMMLSKFAETRGILGVVMDRLTGRRRKIFEYKQT